MVIADKLPRTKADTRALAYEAAGQLMLEGVFPTIELIEKRIGIKNRVAISGALSQWRTDHAASFNERHLMPSLPNGVSTLMESLWVKAIEEARLQAETGLAEQRDKLEAARLEARAEVDTALTQTKEAREERDRAQAARLQAAASADELRVQISALRDDLSGEKSARASVEGRLGQLAEEARAARAHADAVQASSIEAARLAEERYKGLENFQLNEMDELRARAKAAEAALSRQSGDSMVRENALRAEVSSAREESAKLLGKIEMMQDEIRRSEEKITTQGQALTALSLENQRITADLATVSRTLEETVAANEESKVKRE